MPGQSEDVGALRSGQTAARMTDEDHDRAVGFLDRDGMAQPIVLGHARRHEFAAGVVAGSERDREAQECAQAAQGAMAIGRCDACHRSVLFPVAQAVPSQSMMKP